MEKDMVVNLFASALKDLNVSHCFNGEYVDEFEYYRDRYIDNIKSVYSDYVKDSSIARALPVCNFKDLTEPEIAFILRWVSEFARVGKNKGAKFTVTRDVYVNTINWDKNTAGVNITDINFTNLHLLFLIGSIEGLSLSSYYHIDNTRNINAKFIRDYIESIKTFETVYSDIFNPDYNKYKYTFSNMFPIISSTIYKWALNSDMRISEIFTYSVLRLQTNSSKACKYSEYIFKQIACEYLENSSSKNLFTGAVNPVYDYFSIEYTGLQSIITRTRYNGVVTNLSNKDKEYLRGLLVPIHTKGDFKYITNLGIGITLENHDVDALPYRYYNILKVLIKDQYCDLLYEPFYDKMIKSVLESIGSKSDTYYSREHINLIIEYATKHKVDIANIHRKLILKSVI